MDKEDNISLVKRIIAITDDMKAIPKTVKAGGVKYAYRGIDDVRNALNPLLVKHGVVIGSEVISFNREFAMMQTYNGEKLMHWVHLHMRYTAHANGETLTFDGISSSVDNSDKASGKAHSYCFKNAMFDLLCLPTDEENEKDNHELAAPQLQAPVQQPVKKEPTKEQLIEKGKGYLERANDLDQLGSANDWCKTKGVMSNLAAIYLTKKAALLGITTAELAQQITELDKDTKQEKEMGETVATVRDANTALSLEEQGKAYLADCKTLERLGEIVAWAKAQRVVSKLQRLIKAKETELNDLKAAQA